MRQHLDYLFSALRYPFARELGFMQMGLGIERRAEKYASAWGPHFAKSKRVQSEWLASGESKDSCLVLGAGRLYDFDLDCFAANFRRLIFLDADPLSLRGWEKKKQKFPQVEFRFQLCEMSGCLAEWSRGLSNLSQKKDFAGILEFLSRLGESGEALATPLEIAIKKFKPSHILSLNTLSQLPVMWQNAVERSLVIGFGAKEAQAREQEWLNAYQVSGRRLVREHLETLAASEATSMLILSDVEYFFYPIVSGLNGLLPVRWQETENEGRWELSEACDDSSLLGACSSFDALLGVNIENVKLLRHMFPKYEAQLRDTWEWNIVPQAEKEDSQGTCHRVRALELRRNETVSE